MIEEKVLLKLLEGIRKGNEYMYENDSVSACKAWELVWKTLLVAMDEGGYDNINDFDEDFFGDLNAKDLWHGQECIYNWASDYECELGNASLDDISFAKKRIDFCTWYISKFGDESEINVLAMKRAIAETYFQLGNKEEGEKLFTKYLKKNPTWGSGWIGWSDQYGLLASSENKDDVKAIELLNKALKVEDLEERVHVQDRLKTLYKELGMNKEADAIEIDEYEDLDGIPLSEMGDYAEFSKTVIDNNTVSELLEISFKNVGRNDPCPCSSGKKYKKCCGK